jgi:tRNA(adenine34) deaminase
LILSGEFRGYRNVVRDNDFAWDSWLLAMLISSMGIPSKSLKIKRSMKLSALDEERMAALVAFTARSMETGRPVPFGCSIVHTETGALLMRRLNAVAPEFDPSSHAEVRTIRYATKKLKSVSLKGYTLYTTCEPCPMCMSAALWASIDRVVYGAMIEDASRHCNQIHIHANEIVERSDMRCVVDGPVLREECYGLFTHPNMLRAFSLWSTRKTKAKKSK